MKQTLLLNKFLDARVPPKSIEGLISLSRNVNYVDDQGNKFKEVSLGEDIHGDFIHLYVPIISNHISYENLLFLDEISGGTHNSEIIRESIDELKQALVDRRSNLSVPGLIYGIKEGYSKGFCLDLKTMVDKVLNNLSKDLFDEEENFKQEANISKIKGDEYLR